MLSDEERAALIAQVESHLGDNPLRVFSESYIKDQDVLEVEGKKYYAVLWMRDKEFKEGVPPSDTLPLLFTKAQLDSASNRARGLVEIQNLTYLAVSGIRQDKPTKEEEEAAVMELVFKYFTPGDLFKAWILSMFK